MLDTMFELPGMMDVNECIIDRDALNGGKPRLVYGARRRTGRRGAMEASVPDSEVS